MRWSLTVAVLSAVTAKPAALKLAKSELRPVPATFEALVAGRAGSSFSEVARVVSVETPALAPDEVLVQVCYAGVNGGCETFRARGDHMFAGNRESSDFALGAEGVGLVAAVGAEVTEVAVGESVCFVNAAFAEYATSKASMLWRVPEASPEYVGLRISALTACAMLEETGQVRAGETVLVTAAAGGAGHYAVQIAKLAGATVVGTCSSERKARVLEALGVDHVINYKAHDDLAAAFRAVAPGGFDVVLEGVGGRMLKAALDALAPRGKLLQIGYISEYPHNADRDAEAGAHDLAADDMFWNKETVRRGDQVIIGNAWPDFASVVKKKDRVLSLFAEGGLTSLVDEVPFEGLASIPAAIDHMLSGTTVGKVVVKVGP